ncbi:MAG: hypothetical protein GY801_29695 [bacterium]|nr:hypothetical protein [bacterium]
MKLLLTPNGKDTLFIVMKIPDDEIIDALSYHVRDEWVILRHSEHLFTPLREEMTTHNNREPHKK